MADDLESIVPPEIVAEMEAVYNEPYSITDARVAGQNTKSTKGLAAAVMAASGAEMQEIADVLGFNSARHAELAVQRALADKFDSWDKETLKQLFMARLEGLWRGAYARSQSKGYFAREAAAKTALATLQEQIKFAGVATPSEHIIHSPAATEINILIQTLTDQQVSRLPQEVDVLEGHVVSEIEP
jgi:hypothetical protein